MTVDGYVVGGKKFVSLDDIKAWVTDSLILALEHPDLTAGSLLRQMRDILLKMESGK